MANVIDELVLRLSLDAKQFTEGQQKAVEAAKKAVERLLAHGKEAEAAGKRGAEFFSQLRTQALGLFTTFAGATGFASFAAHVTQNDSALYRFSQTIGKSTKEVSAWDATFEKITGRGGLGQQIFGRIAQASSDLLMRGDAEWFVNLQKALGPGSPLSNFMDNGGNIRDTTKLLDALIDSLSRMPKAAAMAFTQALGFPPDVLYAIEQGTDKIRATREEMTRLAAINDKMGAESQKVIEQWNRISLEVTGALKKQWYGLLEGVLDFYDLLTGEGKFSNRKLAPWITEFRDWLGGLSRFFGGGTAPAPASAALPAPAGGGSATMPLPSFSALPEATGGVPAKPGAGTASVSTYALAQVLQAGVPGFNRVTAYQDEMHQGWRSAHNEGRALDFTVGDPRQAAATSAAIRAKLAAMGVDASVLDEYDNPSSHATGGHIHVQFNSGAAAQRFTDMARGGAGGGASTVNIGTINVQTQATDANGIARDIRAAIARDSFARQADGGLQ